MSSSLLLIVSAAAARELYLFEVKSQGNSRICFSRSLLRSCSLKPRRDRPVPVFPRQISSAMFELDTHPSPIHPTIVLIEFRPDLIELQASIIKALFSFLFFSFIFSLNKSSNASNLRFHFLR